MRVNLPKNIQKYESKFVANLTVRQFTFLAVSLGLFAGSAYLLSRITSLFLACFFAAILALPVLMNGFLKVSGLYFDKVLIRLIRANVRPYQKEGFKK